MRQRAVMVARVVIGGAAPTLHVTLPEQQCLPRTMANALHDRFFDSRRFDRDVPHHLSGIDSSIRLVWQLSSEQMARVRALGGRS